MGRLSKSDDHQIPPVLGNAASGFCLFRELDLRQNYCGKHHRAANVLADGHLLVQDN